jgi:hypothetical protein
MKFPSVAILTALLVSTRFASASVAPEVELVSNLPIANGAPAVEVNADTWIAESFTIPATYTSFDGLHVVVNQKLNFLGIEVGLQKTGTGATAAYSFRLYNNLPPKGDVQPMPGTPQQDIGLFGMTKFEVPASLALPTTPTYGTFLLDSFSTVTLTPGFTYWVVLTSKNPVNVTSKKVTSVNPNFLSWIFSTNTPTGLPQGTLNTSTSGILVSQDQGKTWTSGTSVSPALPSGVPALEVHVVAL